MNQPYPLPATDVIIEYKNCVKEGIVLITRKYNSKGKIALPGGHAELGLTLEDNAVKEAKEETGLDVIIQNPNRPWVYSDGNRDPRGHYISNTYIATGTGTIEAGDDAATATLYSLDEVVNLLDKNKFAFDHEDIVKDYLRHRRVL